MKRHIQHILFLLAGTLLLASCHSAKQAGSGQTSTANESAYKQRVISNSQTAGAITAKIKARIIDPIKNQFVPSIVIVTE